MDIRRDDLKQKKRRRQIGFGVVGVLLLAAAVLTLANLDPAAPGVERSSVWMDTVKRGEMLREVRGPGVLVPKEIRWVSAQTSGRVERIVVKPGARVEADTVILELSNPEVMEAELAAESAATAAEADMAARQMTLESQLLDQRANLAGVVADYQSATLLAEAEGELAERGIIPSIQYRRSQLAADQLKLRTGIEQERIVKLEQTIQAQMRAERARVAQLQNTADLRRRQREGLRVVAGVPGVLQQVPVEEGQQVAAGVNLARVARPELLMAELRIAETQAKDIVLGQPVRVDTRNGIVAGEVIRIDPAVQSGTVLVDVELGGELPPGARPDLSVDGTIEIERLDDVLYVGRPAFGQPESSTTLFRVGPDGDEALRVPVRLGRASVNLIEVAEGLAEGDRVLLSDTSSWDAFDRIRLQ